MVFSSVLFLCLFLPALLTAYYVLPARCRNAVALTGSLVFYAWGAPQFVFLLITTSYSDYLCSRWMVALGPGRRARGILAVAMGINLAIFLYAKYMNFFVEQVNELLQLTGHLSMTWTAVVMPIGISFFTFQKLSYLIDVHRRVAEPAPGFSHYLLYVSLFPQLIAGPIVRYHDVSQQLVERDHTDERFLTGVWRFSLGLGKKVLIANSLAVAADAAFGPTAGTMPDPTSLTCAAAWAAAICYAMQIYFDFSGYSDMAIGLGLMLGFRFLENFNYPYVSRTITEFWRRWHISLSNWMREYLYIPLGGNRVASWRIYVNLWIVFLLSGFWHGASWNFIMWGALHGALLTAERIAARRSWPTWPAVFALPRTLLLVLITWVFFRAWDLPQAMSYLGVMFTPWSVSTADAITLAQIMSPATYAVLTLALAISVVPLWTSAHAWLKDWTIVETSGRAGLQLAARAALSILLLAGSFVFLVSSSFNPFIYFRF